MTPRVFLLAFFGGANIVFAQAASGRGEIRGTVADATGKPLAGVEVFAPGASISVSSNERGHFRIPSVDTGTHRIVARRAGWSPETLSVGVSASRAVGVRFTLAPVVAQLSEVVVREEAAVLPRLEGFERRRQRRMGGQFITREEIEKRNPLVTTDLLRRMQGLKIIDSSGMPVAVSTRGPKPNLTGRGRAQQPFAHCVLRVGLNGFLNSAIAINSIPPRDIYGIELYGGGSVPSEFGGGRPDMYCGVIMIWSK